MPPKRFLMYLSESVNKSKLRKMCEIMELTQEETTLVLNRFCDGMNIDQIADLYFISPMRQRKLVSDLENKVIGWIVDNLGFFNDKELKILHNWLPPE